MSASSLSILFGPLTRLLERDVCAAAVAGFGLSFVDVSLQVADHVRLAGDGHRTHHAVVVGHVSPRCLDTKHQSNSSNLGAKEEINCNY